MLCEARDIAISVGDAETALASIVALAESFVVDGNAMSVEAIVLMNAKGGIEDSAVICELGLQLLGRLVENGQYELASKLVPAIRSTATKARKPALLAAANAGIANAEVGDCRVGKGEARPSATEDRPCRPRGQHRGRQVSLLPQG